MKNMFVFLITIIFLSACNNNNISDNKRNIEQGNNKGFVSDTSPENQILKILSEYNFFDETIDESKNQYEIYSYDLHDNEKVFLTFTYSEEYACHACGTYMSVFVFDKNNRLLKKYIKVDQNGAWGRPPTQNSIKIIDSDNNFLITLESGFTGQGITQENLLCYYVTPDAAELIGNFEILSDNTGALPLKTTSWEADYTFKTVKNNEVPELQIVRQGIQDDIDFIDTNNYFFDGKNYVRVLN